MEGIRGIDPRAVDALVALLFTGIALWTVTDRVGTHDEFRGDDFAGIALLLLQTLPIAARRAYPLAALTVSVAAISLHIALGYEGVPAGTFAALVILYSAASLTDARAGLVALLVGFAGISVYFLTDRSDPGVAAALATYATYGAAWGLGTYVRSRRQYTDLVEERATLLERSRELRAREAVADERVRIARELHDIIGHALNLIVIQAGGAQRVLESKPDLVRDSLESIEATGREALDEMERVLGILRSTEDTARGHAPQPGLDQLTALAAHVSEAGLPVEVAVEGTPVPLPSSVDLSAYRIIQEALTNALKHAGPARARVRLRYTANDLELEVTDDGRGTTRELEGEHHGGRGLVGMQERAAIFGGHLAAGPSPSGGFRVHAILPIGSGPE